MKPSSNVEDVKSIAQARGEVCLVDTSVWIRADRRRQKTIQDRLKALVITGSAYTCWPVRTELLIGAKDEKRFQALDEQLSALPLLSTADDTWRQTAQMGQKLARIGQTVPLIDLLISSIAIESSMTLWTVDSDFKRVEAISELRVNWFGMQ